MTDERSVRIITNSVLDELIGEEGEARNSCEVNLQTHIVTYHEGQELGGPLRRNAIAESLNQVGFPLASLQARHDPPCPLPTDRGPIQDWADRFTALIEVPRMSTVRDATIVVQAIAHARTGDRPDRIFIDRRRRTLTVLFDKRSTAPRNFEAAIAAAGFEVNGTKPEGRPDQALRIRWAQSGS